MLAKRIIPCLDVEKGRVVKGTRFLELVDAGDPVEQARVYDRAGADELCFLDITASHEGRETTVRTVERMAAEVFIPLTVGGGIRTVEDIRIMLNAGADKVSINTAAIHQPQFVRRAADHEVRLLANVLPYVPPRALLKALEGQGEWPHNVFKLYWPMASADSFAPQRPSDGAGSDAPVSSWGLLA